MSRLLTGCCLDCCHAPAAGLLLLEKRITCTAREKPEFALISHRDTIIRTGVLEMGLNY
jgi:hypothetical protein